MHGMKWMFNARSAARLSALLITALVVLSCTVAVGQVGDDLMFSTEEEFITQGPTPADGNPIISDGDLLDAQCQVYARNADLLKPFGLAVDLGLDAADVLDKDTYLVAFSTEQDSPLAGQFTAGDLLITNGAVVPNVALLWAHGQQSGYTPEVDLGLDAVHFLGEAENIERCLQQIALIPRQAWILAPGQLSETLRRHEIDIWFSVEGTQRMSSIPLLDGDLVSAAYGGIPRGNGQLLPPSVPAGVPSRGVDFGLDAYTAKERGIETPPELGWFSTEILFLGAPAFTDGDLLQVSTGAIICVNSQLLVCFEPRAMFLGLDALTIPMVFPSVTRSPGTQRSP